MKSPSIGGGFSEASNSLRSNQVPLFEELGRASNLLRSTEVHLRHESEAKQGGSDLTTKHKPWLNKKVEKLGVALVGLGKYSEEQLAPALLQTTKCRLTGIVTGNAGKAAEWEKKYDIPA